jgi:hypothetical protein
MSPALKGKHREALANAANGSLSTSNWNKHDPSTPVFTMANGDLVTTGYINRVLASLLEDENPKITTKAFRPALATILAQQGGTPEELKNLGRWTSRAFEAYIRRGRANNWRGARTQMLKATKCN